MIPELSIMPASPDGNSFEIVPGDMTGISYADYVRSLRSAEESLYSRLLVFRRNPGKKVLFGDVEALLGYSTGMYILVNTKLTGKNKRSVFAGVAGIDQLTADDCWGINYIPEPDADCYLPLVECMRKQSDEPPLNMGKWDLAIVIPTQDKNPELFRKLCKLLDNSEDFICWHEPTVKIEVDLEKDLVSTFSYFQNIDFSSFDPDFIDALINFLFQMKEEMSARLMEEGIKQLLKVISGRKAFASIKFDSQNFSLKMKSKKKEIILSIKINSKDFGKTKMNFNWPRKSNTTR